MNVQLDTANLKASINGLLDKKGSLVQVSAEHQSKALNEISKLKDDLTKKKGKKAEEETPCDREADEKEAVKEGDEVIRKLEQKKKRQQKKEQKKLAAKEKKVKAE